jgi:transcriptional regulator with XRE-family HTH domain
VFFLRTEAGKHRFPGNSPPLKLAGGKFAHSIKRIFSSGHISVIKEEVALDAGRKLRALREQLGLTLRQVEALSSKLAAKHKNSGFAIPLSRLSEIESKGVVPSAYRFYCLSVIYRRDLRELLGFYGMDVNQAAADSNLVEAPNSHLSDVLDYAGVVKVPLRTAPDFDPLRTSHLGTLIEEWGVVPLASLNQFANPNYSYGYVGTEDFMMYPILPPGSFVQVDESKNKVMEGSWRSEYERPIFFVETRKGYKCCWCSLKNDQITLQPHPLSPESAEVLRHPQEAEVIGQIVGVAMRLHARHMPSP